MAVMKGKQKQEVLPPEAGERPDWVIRARQAEGSEYFVTLGSGWTKQGKDGQEFISLRFNTVPAGGLTNCLLMRPLPPRE